MAELFLAATSLQWRCGFFMAAHRGCFGCHGVALQNGRGGSCGVA